MDEEKLFQLQKKIAEAVCSLRECIIKICDPLSDTEITELAFHFHTEAKPTGCHNFPMPMYEEISCMLNGELAIRCMFRQAKEYMETTGEPYFCVACGGACKGHE